ncbi:glycosyltransferase family 4 protein [Paraglaciecola sp. 25GB23A]|uniref:glycosyltransferase family 4 protein n=1 Tax=Paraglaciecola sp. 25GB23A TaxID=3156068 RepID=UPI0032AF553C
MPDVVIVQHRLLHYRVELFEIVKKYLAKEGIQLYLVHGGPSNKEATRKDVGTLKWAHEIRNYFFTIKGVDLIWQPLPKITDSCDLLILMQENRIISNYSKILKRYLLNKKVAFWGHGQNLQSANPSGLREIWKKKWLKSVNWWFAYTTSTVDYLISQNYPRDQITCLNNAIDVNGFKAELSQVTEHDLVILRQELNIPESSLIGIFCGSLYPEKRLDLMLDAVDLIIDAIPNFQLIVIGDGPSKPFLQEAAMKRAWLKLVGVKKGFEKAKYFRLASVILNPGLVGLHILDSFCAGVPMVTTRDALHSPEYDYLENGKNGLVTKGTASDFANAIVKLLGDSATLNEMQRNAFLDSQKYTVEEMARRFANGIISAVNASKE